MSKTKYIERPFEVKEVGDDGTFTGYGSVFGELDSYRDIVMPGAFTQSLKEDFADKNRKVPMLWQHNSWAPIGVYIDIHEDAKGLFVKGQCNMDVQQGKECHALMKQGALSGLSIGYTTVTSEWDEANLIRKLHRVNLWEVSPVTFPAGDKARIDTVKSLEGLASPSELESYLREAYDMSRKEAAMVISRIKAFTRNVSDSVEEKAVGNIKSIIDSLTNKR